MSNCPALAKAFPAFQIDTMKCCGVDNIGTLTITCDDGVTISRLAIGSYPAQLTTFPNLSSLTSLTILYLNAPNFVGNVPGYFANFTKLNYFDMSGSGFNGSMPAGNWSALQTIALPATVQLGPLSQSCVNMPNTPGYYQCGVNAAAVTMPSGTNPPPAVPTGTKTGSTVLFVDPTFNGWNNYQVDDPAPLLRGQYIVAEINGNQLCGGHWAFLYDTGVMGLPSCMGNNGAFNFGDNGVARVNYQGLQYGTCPGASSHPGQNGNGFNFDTYTSCWDAYIQNSNWGSAFPSGNFQFPSGTTVSWCCFA